MQGNYVDAHMGERGIYEICLNAPQNGNRFDREALLALRAAFETVEQNGARAVLLTHEGSAFCLGGLLGDARQQHAGTVWAFAEALKGALRSIWSCTVPVACAVEGAAEGGGVSLVDACDMAAAGEDAHFAIPEILSEMAPVVSFASASRFAPPKRLMKMALLGEALLPNEAEALGLITQAVPRGHAKEQCKQWLLEILARNPAAIATVHMLRRRMDNGEYERRLDTAGDLLVGLMTHQETWMMLDKRETRREEDL